MGEISSRGHVYPIINRQLSKALQSHYRVINNLHNIGNELTEVLFAHEYPIAEPRLKHTLNVCFTAWEFAGNYCFPLCKVEALKEYDLLFVPSQFIQEEIQDQVTIPVKSIHWALDQQEFKRHGKQLYSKLKKDPNKIYLLWVGGTDQRHGMDIALEIIKRLPEQYHLIIKQNAYYPFEEAIAERCTVLHEDLPSLYPLYNLADIFLQTARGVGFSLPVLEALRVGLPVVSSYLPPLQEFKTNRIQMATQGLWVRFEHHLYSDCVPYWWESNVEELVDLILQSPLDRQPPSEEFLAYYQWDTVVSHIQEQL